MDSSLFASDLWKPALDKYAEATGLSVELFGVDEQVVLSADRPVPLVALFREYGFDPGLLVECARRSLLQTHTRPAVVVDESHGLAVVGASLVLEGAIVGAAVAGYALAGFSNVTAVRRWAVSAGIPFDRLWNITRRLPPVPERRLRLHGELLQILGDALLRENYRTRQYEDAVSKLNAASAAKDEFLAVVSHELRTPLAPILGWASILKKNESPEQVRRAAEAIERNVLLQSRMVDDLLDVNRLRYGTLSLDLKIQDVRAVLRGAVETSAGGIEKKSIRVEQNDANERLLVKGDAGRLQQVFGNILSNAVKFTPAGGSIFITIKQEADQALVVIADTGAGMAAEFLPFAFDMFRQQEHALHRSHEGLGIGLALVKRLTELHNGTVEIASAGSGQGTAVAIRLPLADAISDPGEEAALPGAAPGSLPLTGLSALVVEDSEDARESLRFLLRLLGAKVSVACDGGEALRIMKQGANPDFVLCDLLMPNVDGFEFIRELELAPSPVHPPVIAVSGLASEASRERALAAGFEGHIKKPYSEADIIAAVGAAFRHRGEKQIPAR